MPYAAHGDGFSFVLGLLDRKNRESNEFVAETIPEGSILNYQTELNGKPTKSSLAGNADNVVVNNLQYDSQLSLLGKQPTQKKGQILQMSVGEGVSIIRSCIDAVRKRTLASLGSCRVKGVSSGGCMDLGCV